MDDQTLSNLLEGETVEFVAVEEEVLETNFVTSSVNKRYL